MEATVYRPLSVVAFNANGIGRQAYELRKQMQDLKIDVALFKNTPENTYEVQHPKLSYTVYRNDRLYGNKDGTAVEVKTVIPQNYVDLPPLLSLEATRVNIPIGHTEMLLASLY
jgi:hypothetical protein